MFDMCSDVQQVFSGHLVSTPYVVPNDDGGDFLEAQDRGCFREISEQGSNLEMPDRSEESASPAIRSLAEISLGSTGNDHFFLHLHHRGAPRHSRHLWSDAFAATHHSKSVNKNKTPFRKHPQFFDHIRVQ